MQTKCLWRIYLITFLTISTWLLILSKEHTAIVSMRMKYLQKLSYTNTIIVTRVWQFIVSWPSASSRYLSEYFSGKYNSSFGDWNVRGPVCVCVCVCVRACVHGRVCVVCVHGCEDGKWMRNILSVYTTTSENIGLRHVQLVCNNLGDAHLKLGQYQSSLIV